MNKDKIFATIVTSITILSIILIIIFIFKNSDDDKVKNFVSKNGEAITVSLASSKWIENRHLNKHKKIVKTKHKENITKKIVKPKKDIKKHKPKPKPKKHKHKHKHKKEIVKKKKRVQKSKSNHKREVERVKTNKLFSSINKKDTLNKNSISKKKGEGKGEINRYLATIEKRLRGWPAQRNFAGEEIDVWLKIYPNGKFEYKIKKYSQNSDFNKALISYLDDLKRFGFEPHKGNRAYEIEVEFIAHN